MSLKVSESSEINVTNDFAEEQVTANTIVSFDIHVYLVTQFKKILQYKILSLFISVMSQFLCCSALLNRVEKTFSVFSKFKMLVVFCPQVSGSTVMTLR